MNDPMALAATDPEDRHEIPDLQDRHDDSTGPGHPSTAPAVPADVALPAGCLDTDRAEAPAGPRPHAHPPADHHAAPHRERPPVTRPEPRPPAPRAGGALRHVLRWPVAAALLLCGVLHLPRDPAALSVLGPGDVPPLAVAFVCLVEGGLLMARDTPAVWRTGAVTALAIVALHVVAGIALVDPLEGSLGGPHAWAGVTTVLCAGAGAVLAGVALMYRPKRVDRV
ncbi:hypothetical protein [Streptomyces sp. NPDC002602]|uniref:hypothetical protein n=1 Tax=Streptomyces sp. NPDC002602 TaxID=3364654 RepID=UPI00369CA143